MSSVSAPEQAPAGTGEEQTSSPSTVPRQSYLDDEGHADTSVLQDRMPVCLRMSRGTALLVGMHGLMFTVLSYAPLWHTDLWGHLAYGRWIAQHRLLPTTEPMLPLCQGVPFVDTAWLSQLLAYGMFESFGISGLMFLYALAITLTTAILSFCIYQRTGLPWVAAGTACLFYLLNYQQLLIARPQLAGLLLFTLVFGMVSSPRWNRWNFVWIPLLFAAWANLHGSFVVGLALLGTLCLGRWIDVWRRTRNGAMACKETQVRRLFVLTELAAAATLLNPYGIGLIAEVVSISSNPNFSDLIEWEPLTLRMSQGKAFFATVLLLMGFYRFSPRRVTSGEALLLAGLGISALWTSRMIVWWSPLAAYYAGLHAAAVYRKWWKPAFADPMRTGVWSIVAVGLLWIFFAYTPFAAKVMHGRPATAADAAKQFKKFVSPQTPLDATHYLLEHPPKGLVFNTYEWGDYLLWAGPEKMQLFVASHAHLVPAEVWQDYMLIAYAGGGWDEKLDRYGVTTILIDRTAQSALARQLNENDKWTRQREDGISALYVRKASL